MTTKEKKQLFEDAITTWGKMAQYDQCIEEMAELIIAINKCKRHTLYGETFNFDNEENLIEEIADVELCVGQLKYMVGEKKVNDMLVKKIAKMKSLMEKSKQK